MRDELEFLAALFHAGLTGGHLFACVYNARRGNWKWVAFHVAAAGIDLVGARNHWRETRRPEVSRRFLHDEPHFV